MDSNFGGSVERRLTEGGGASRRTVVKGAAWSVPVLATTVASVPLAAATGGGSPCAGVPCAANTYTVSASDAGRGELIVPLPETFTAIVFEVSGGNSGDFWSANVGGSYYDSGSGATHTGTIPQSALAGACSLKLIAGQSVPKGYYGYQFTLNTYPDGGKGYGNGGNGSFVRYSDVYPGNDNKPFTHGSGGGGGSALLIGDAATVDDAAVPLVVAGGGGTRAATHSGPVYGRHAAPWGGMAKGGLLGGANTGAGGKGMGMAMPDSLLVPETIWLEGSNGGTQAAPGQPATQDGVAAGQYLFFDDWVLGQPGNGRDGGNAQQKYLGGGGGGGGYKGGAGGSAGAGGFTNSTNRWSTGVGGGAGASYAAPGVEITTSTYHPDETVNDLTHGSVTITIIC